jgi:hypothetical protein
MRARDQKNFSTDLPGAPRTERGTTSDQTGQVIRADAE